MRRSTSLMAEWGVSIKEGTRLAFENCKGGVFSVLDAFGLQVNGKTALSDRPSAEAPADIRCVKAGTKLLCRGKNLFNKNESSSAAIRNESAGGFWGTNLFPAGYDLRKLLPPSETVTLSFDVECTAIPDGYLKTPSGFTLGLNLLGTDTTIFIPGWLAVGATVHKSLTFTTPADLSGVTLRAYANRYTLSGRENDADVAISQVIFRNIQVELGDTETPYEPYYESEITVPCDLYAGDKWYPATGKVIKANSLISFDGTESWQASVQNGKRRFCLILGGAPYQARDFRGVCNGIEVGSYQEVADGTKSAYCASGIFALFTAHGDLVAFKAWLSSLSAAGKPLTLVYEKLNPATVQYPPQPLSAPVGAVNVTSLPLELSPDLSAAMLVKF